MPLTKIDFAPGLNKDDSPLAAEGGWIDADKVRFVNGRPQTIGGWQMMTMDSFAGIARGAHAWETLIGRRFLAWGTESHLYVLTGGAIRDITPPHSEGVLTDPFTTTAGSTGVTVEHPTPHGFRTGQTVTFTNQSAPVGGLTISGHSYVVTVDSDTTYTIQSVTGAAASSATGGGNVDYSATLPVGRVSAGGEPGGYGSGPYGSGGYGIGDGGTRASDDLLPRVWFLDNWGETLLALPRGGGLYQYQPALDYPELVTNGGFDTVAGWTTGAGWSIGGGIASAAAGSGSDLTAPVTVTPGYVYRVSFNAAVVAGTLNVRTDAGMLGAASSAISVSGSYSRRFRAPAGMTQIVFRKDASFTGSIDGVSIALEDVAYRIDEAPVASSVMFVDPHQIVVLLGTNPYLGPYGATVIRWSALKDLTDWIPTVANLSGDDTISYGGRIVGAIATRLQNLIWTDTALVTMQYTGDTTKPFLFALAGSGCGLIGALARTEHNGMVFWAGRGNFFSYAGSVPLPIPCKIERDVFEHIAANQGEKIACGVIPGRSEVWFLYPDSRDGDECSRYAALRYDEAHWTAGTFARSAFVKPGVYEFPIMFGTDGRVYEHEIGQSANGAVLNPWIESAYFDIGDGDHLMMVRRIVGDFDDLVGPVDFTVYGRKWPTESDIVYGPFMHTGAKRKLDFLMKARQVKIRLASEATPLFWRLGAVQLDIVPLGEML